MHPATPPVRTHRNLPTHQSLQELLGERLRQSPWLVLSAAVHTVALLLVWVLFPTEPARKPLLHTEIVFDEPTRIVEPEKPEPPTTEPEVVVDDNTVQDPQPIAEADTADASSDELAEAAPSAFEFNQWNHACGLHGGPAGRYSGRGPHGGGNGRGHAGSPYVTLGLAWLARHQDDDGKWDGDRFMKHDDVAHAVCGGPGSPVHDVGLTGLALLAFLGDGNTMRAGPYRDVVKRGVLWLLDQQDEGTGRFGGTASHDFVYDHAIAAYAICEAYGLSDYRLLRKPAQRGIDYLEAHRNPYAAWRYQPRDNDNDISVTGWCIMAYESGSAFGLQVSKAALDSATAYLDQVTDAHGVHGYQRPSEPSSRRPGDHATQFPVDKTHALTAVGLFARCFLGQTPAETPVMDLACDRIVERLPAWDEAAGAIDHYYWYYATYALFQMGGPRWSRWQKALVRAVAPNQHTDPAEPNLLGSWDPVGAWGSDGGRVYSTAILTLTMQASYRYSRLLR